MRRKVFFTLEPHARKYCACKRRAVRCGLCTHRILILPYQAMFGSLSVPHLALHLATSLPGRKLWMSSSRVDCPNWYGCMMEIRARHAEPSAEHTVQLFFAYYTSDTMGEIATRTHLMAPHFRPRRAEPQPNRTQSSTPFRIVEVWDTPPQPQT